MLSDDQGRIEKAKEYRANGDYRTAIIELKKVLQGNPDNREARFLLGELSLAVGQAADAEKELRRAQKLGTPEADVLIPLGQALLAQGAYERVLEEIDTSAIEAVEAQVEISLIRGDAYLATGKLDEAQRVFRHALELKEDSLAAQIGLARTATAKGDIDAAETYISRVISTDPDYVAAWLAKGELEFNRRRYADAEQAFTHAISGGDTGPTVVQEFTARSGLAEAQWRQGKSEQALDNIEILLRAAPRHPWPSYLRALVAYGNRDYSIAATYLQKVLQASPDHKPSKLLLGAVNYAQGNLEQADMYLSSVVATDPSDISARKLLAATRIRQKHPGDAVATLAPALEQGSGDAQLLAMMREASVQAGNPELGIEHLERGLQSDPDNLAMQMELVKAYFATGKIEQAIEALERLPETKTGPYRRELLLMLAYLRSEDTKSAIAEAEKLLVNRPNDADVHSLAGAVHMAAGEYKDGRVHFERALQLRPENATILMNLGRLDYLEGRQDAARARFQRVLEFNPQNASAMLALAQLSALRGDETQTLKWLEQARESDPRAIAPRLALVRYHILKHDFERAQEIAAETVEIAPNDANALSALGVTQLRAGKNREAVDSFRRAVKAAPKSANHHYNLARVQLAVQSFGEAKEILSRVLALQPNHIPAIYTLALLEVREGKGKRAFARARKLQQTHPEQPVGYALEGDLHMVQNKFGNAVRAYQAALKRADNRTLTVKLFTAQKRANVPNATRTLEQWLEKYPSDLALRLMLGQAYQQQNRNNVAIDQYELILKGQPNNAVVLNNLGWLYHLQRDPRAIKTAEHAHRIEPQNGAITDTLGWLLVEHGQLQRGVQLLRQAVEQAPKVPDIQYHLAVALVRSGDHEEARKTLTELLESGAAFKERAEAEQLLKTL